MVDDGCNMIINIKSIIYDDEYITLYHFDIHNIMHWLSAGEKYSYLQTYHSLKKNELG